MKTIKKSDCIFDADGYIKTGKKKNKIVGIPHKICDQLEKLDTSIQLSIWYKAQPKATPAPDLDDFEPVSMFTPKWNIEQPETPAMNRKIAETLQFIEEVNEKDKVLATHKGIEENLADLMNWAEQDYILDGLGMIPSRIDLPILGERLLTLTPQDIADLCVKYDIFVEED